MNAGIELVGFSNEVLSGKEVIVGGSILVIENSYYIPIYPLLCKIAPDIVLLSFMFQYDLDL